MVVLTSRCPQDDGQPPGTLRMHDAVEPRDLLTEHLAVQEQQRAQRLVLGGGRHLSLNSKRRQELRDPAVRSNAGLGLAGVTTNSHAG